MVHIIITAQTIIFPFNRSPSAKGYGVTHPITALDDVPTISRLVTGTEAEGDHRPPALPDNSDGGRGGQDFALFPHPILTPRSPEAGSSETGEEGLEV